MEICRWSVADGNTMGVKLFSRRNCDGIGSSTTFTLALAAAKTSSYAIESNPKRRILVIDDNHAIHNDFRKIFCGSGGGRSDGRLRGGIVWRSAGHSEARQFRS